MKKIVKYTLLTTMVVLAVACSKDQKAVKELEGTWEVTKQDGQTVSDSDKFTLKFDYCKLRKDEYCKYTQSDNDGYSYQADYKVIDKGGTLVQAVNDTSKGEIQLQSSIDELTDTKLVLTLNFGGFLSTSEFEKK